MTPVLEGQIDVLVVEDDPVHLKLLLTRLGGLGLNVEAAADGQRGWQILEQRRPKVVLSDWVMPGLDGVQLCRKVKASPELQSCHFILVTVKDQIGSKTMALDSGADDYLVKPYDFRELVARLHVGLRVWQLQHNLKQAAVTDMLTGLYNQHHLLVLLDREFRLAGQYGRPISVLFADIDHFKLINDTFGHEAGNKAIQQVAKVLRDGLESTDLIARYGGDEFCAILPDRRLDEAASLGEAFLAGVRKITLDHAGRLSCSVGVACSEGPCVSTPSDLIKLADKALYKAKADGRGCVRTAETVDASQEPTGPIDMARVDALKDRFGAFGRQTRDAGVNSIFALVHALEVRHPYTAYHSRNATWYAEQLALQLGLDQATVGVIKRAAMLHDVGKVAVPDSILNKVDPLTDEERLILRHTPVISAQIAAQLGFLAAELPIIRHQREWFDGTGYPMGLAGENIPLGARVLAVANAFDAMTTDRAYRSRRTIPQAIEEIQSMAGRQFDPKVAQALQRCWLLAGHEWQRKVDRVTSWVNQHVSAPPAGEAGLVSVGAVGCSRIG